MSAPRERPNPPYTIQEFGASIKLSRELWEDLAFVRKPRREPAYALIGNVTVARETEKALLVRVPPEGVQREQVYIPLELWIPKSQLTHPDNEIRKLGDQGFMVIPEWLAREKKLI